MIDDDLYAGPLAVTEAITAAVATIRGCWGEILDPPSGNGSGARSALITAGDHDDSDADIDWATRIVSLCAHVAASLNRWCRVVMEDRPITSPKALPLGGDVPGMCIFLARHAEWLGEHEAGPSCASEIEAHAQRVEQVVRPHRREWIYLGPCPFVTLNTGGQFCRGRVRVRIGSDGDEAACSECGQLSPIEWWEAVLLADTGPRWVPAREMAAILSQRLHLAVTDRTLRNWASVGRVNGRQAEGPEPARGWRRPWLFEVRQVLDAVALMDRECPMCGRMWSGRGSACLRCVQAMSDRPLFAEERPAYPVKHLAIASTPETQAPAALLPRCGMSGLPAAWCGCSRHTDSSATG